MNKKVTTHAFTKKRTRPRKHARVREKKNLLKKTHTRPRKRPRKKELVQEETKTAKKVTKKHAFGQEITISIRKTLIQDK